MNQLSLLNLNEREYKIAVHIIGSIDDDGYLRRDPLAIIDDLMFTQNIDATRKEILGILKSVQQFDPPGIGARDLQECLIIQLKVKAVKPGNSPDQKKKIEAGTVPYKQLPTHQNRVVLPYRLLALKKKRKREQTDKHRKTNKLLTNRKTQNCTRTDQ